jgi:hypothetical protein
MAFLGRLDAFLGQLMVFQVQGGVCSEAGDGVTVVGGCFPGAVMAFVAEVGGFLRRTIAFLRKVRGCRGQACLVEQGGCLEV